MGKKKLFLINHTKLRRRRTLRAQPGKLSCVFSPGPVAEKEKPELNLPTTTKSNMKGGKFTSKNIDRFK